MEKEFKGKDHGPQKEEVLTQEIGALDGNKIPKGPKQTRWGQQTAPMVLNIVETHFGLTGEPTLLNVN